MRTIFLYLFIIFGIRLLGKRQIGELEPSELVLSLIIADLASVVMQDFGIPLILGIIPILTLLCVSSILSLLTVKNISMRSLLCGRPSTIIYNGKLLPREMLKNRFTADELMEELRLNGETDITKIKVAILETSGRLSVIPYAKARPLTPEDTGKAVSEAGLPLIIINKGILLKHNLAQRNLPFSWLDSQLKARGIEKLEEVFLLTIDEENTIYYTLEQEGT